ncbi:MAG: sugar-binding transcriptional regulator [Propionibacteriaceae bacterium]
MSSVRQVEDGEGRGTRFPTSLLYRGAWLYYKEDRTQAEIGELLGISRATVSRLLTEARAQGVVYIEIRDPSAGELDSLGAALEERLGLARVLVTPNAMGARPGPVLAPSVATLLTEAQLKPGDALVIGSGATMLDISREKLIPLPGVLVVPSVGGQDEHEEYYQTNEVTRSLAVSAGATPVLLHAPVLPSSDIYRSLQTDPGIKRVMSLWRRAQCALLGVGMPPRIRVSLPDVLRRMGADLANVEGDISNRTFDAEGRPVPFDGSDRMFAMGFDDLRRVPYSIAVAVGKDKARGLVAAARGGFINRLVTDSATAHVILDLPPVGVETAPERRKSGRGLWARGKG